MALIRKAMPSPNYSSRGNASVRLIVLHTTEGAMTIESLGNWFANPANQVSSHVGIDDTPGVVGEYVKRDWKAWTSANANPVAVQAELCAYAKWSRSEWYQHEPMLKNAAEWLFEESQAFGIPLTKLTAQQAQTTGRGVCQHVDLGSWGGGHWDCGTGFPIDDVLDVARGWNETDSGVGYPPWFWQWCNWYLNSSRQPANRPPAAPATIPDWAWQALDEVQQVSSRYGMTQGERDWIDWWQGGKQGVRPAVPQTIPEHWWTDNEWVAGRE